MTQPLTERAFDLILWLAGAGHFVILFASAQVPARLRWKEDLAQLMPFNRKLLWVQGGFTVLTIIAFGTLTLVLHTEMLRGDRAAMALACFIGSYWTARASWWMRSIFQRRLAKRKAIRDWPHPADEFVRGARQRLLGTVCVAGLAEG